MPDKPNNPAAHANEEHSTGDWNHAGDWHSEYAEHPLGKQGDKRPQTKINSIAVRSQGTKEPNHRAK